MNACGVCADPSAATLWRNVDGYDYFDCSACGCIALGPDDMAKVDSGEFPRHYGPDYWAMELKAARERSWGPSLARAAEAILYSRRPIERFIDIGTGPGFLLDALKVYLPISSHRVFGVEKFPPSPDMRLSHLG